VFDVLGASMRFNLIWASGFYALIAGCVGAAAAAIPGVIDLFGAIPPRSSARQRGYIHGSLNTLVLVTFIYIAWSRGGPYEPANGWQLGVEAICIIVLGISGWLGGTLVYRNQIGVDRRYANAGKFRERILDDYSHPACNQSELGQGQLMLLRVAGERIALGHTPDGFFAISDHCTHRGGPLCDGALAGNTVQCPWHGSQFDMRNGRVVAGPAVEHAKTYALDIRNGEIYVRDPNASAERKVA
jgi:nitrite reductase/ring-hydroxylating ferredoxin subunit/uncharacterized membrane protein